MLKRLFITLFVVTAIFAHAEPKKVEAKKIQSLPIAQAETFSSRTGFIFSGGADYNFVSFPAYITSVSNRMSLGANLEVDYFFHKNFGAFINVNYLSRGLKSNFSQDSNNTDFLDIPFGLAINTGGFTDESRSHITLGMYYAIPMSNAFTGSFPMGASLNNGKTKSFIGLYVSYQMMFALMEHLGFGIRLYGKIPMGSAIDFGANAADSGTSGYFYEAGAGLTLTTW